ncbi:hypothetical protein FH609_004210 [Streptomyces sp. 3MP-14]|uniref:Uncharacterized protein n=1 Tax=Streptomyces mimosae TaxID=2586635 RepID=A0A5N6A4U0_9ACTN|nr:MULTISPECIES: hypothetical protein [Streptomyces]KAB8162936.1 hypothetical protein FH607_020070 [Streptomyces mimosae]KAB8179150.1 hypothetical protein FH609_004210 [Streptomyces sp. 3MP-14]
MADAEERPEVAAVRTAVRALEAIPDATERATAATELLRGWPELHRLVREIREHAVMTMHGQGMDWPEIGRAIGVDRSRAWRIGHGHDGKRRAGASGGDARQPEG